MKFSILFWNIKNYSGGKRTYQLVDYIRQFDPDILCLCEVNDKAALRSRLTEEMADYNFAITDGPGYIELATGWKKEHPFEQILFTQRREFQAGQETLRPGALLSVKHSGEFYNILFLHTDSGRKRKDYANRQTMFEKIGNLKYTLDSLQTGDARLIVLGDLNTMGRDQFGDLPEVTGDQEITNLNRDVDREGLQVLVKTHKVTNLWSEGESDLDHVLATGNIGFTPQKEGREEPETQVRVYGWNQLTTTKEREKFRQEVSDHSLIYCEVG